MNTTRYKNLGGVNFIFQEDNVVIMLCGNVYKAGSVKSFFASENISVLDWSARFPHLNIRQSSL